MNKTVRVGHIRYILWLAQMNERRIMSKMTDTIRSHSLDDLTLCVSSLFGHVWSRLHRSVSIRTHPKQRSWRLLLALLPGVWCMCLQNLPPLPTGGVFDNQFSYAFGSSHESFVQMKRCD